MKTQELAGVQRYARYMRALSAGTELRSFATAISEAFSEPEDLDEAFEVVEGLLSEMADAIDELPDDRVVEMQQAMDGMENAIEEMKGNAPSHDYSQDDGEYDELENDFDEPGVNESDDSDDDDDEDDDDDDVKEALEEEVASLQEDIDDLRLKLVEHQQMLRKAGACYIVAANTYGIPRAQVGEFVESVKDDEEYDTLVAYESFVQETRAGFGDDSNVSAPAPGFGELGEDEVYSLTDGPLYESISRLFGNN